MEKINSIGIRLTLISLTFGILIFIFKFIAYFITKSVAIYSDAMESIINIFSATMAFIGIKIALKPSDSTHPYGHTKIEYIISILEALFILSASVSILWKAIHSFIQIKPISHLDKGFLFLSPSIALNFFLVYILYKGGKKENSPILISHATHLLSDILTTLGIIGGIVLAKFFNFWILDPLMGILVGINIFYMGFKLIKESISSLLDESLPEEKVASIKTIIDKTLNEAKSDFKTVGMHNFKTRKAGRKGFVEFHLTVNGNIPVKKAHHLCDELEKNIKEKHPELSVIIHVEPHKDKKK